MKPVGKAAIFAAFVCLVLTHIAVLGRLDRVGDLAFFWGGFAWVLGVIWMIVALDD